MRVFFFTKSANISWKESSRPTKLNYSYVPLFLQLGFVGRWNNKREMWKGIVRERERERGRGRKRSGKRSITLNCADIGNSTKGNSILLSSLSKVIQFIVVVVEVVFLHFFRTATVTAQHAFHGWNGLFSVRHRRVDVRTERCCILFLNLHKKKNVKHSFFLFFPVCRKRWKLISLGTIASSGLGIPGTF